MTKRSQTLGVLEGLVISTAHTSELVVARQSAPSYVVLTIGHREAVLSIAEARRLARGLLRAAQRQEEAASAG